jgi:hypothetical protein
MINSESFPASGPRRWLAPQLSTRLPEPLSGSQLIEGRAEIMAASPLNTECSRRRNGISFFRITCRCARCVRHLCSSTLREDAVRQYSGPRCEGRVEHPKRVGETPRESRRLDLPVVILHGGAASSARTERCPLQELGNRSHIADAAIGFSSKILHHDETVSFVAARFPERCSSAPASTAGIIVRRNVR